MSTLFKSNAVAHSDEELLQCSAILHEVFAEGLDCHGVVYAVLSEFYADASWAVVLGCAALSA